VIIAKTSIIASYHHNVVPGIHSCQTSQPINTSSTITWQNSARAEIHYRTNFHLIRLRLTRATPPRRNMLSWCCETDSVTEKLIVLIGRTLSPQYLALLTNT